MRLLSQTHDATSRGVCESLSLSVGDERRNGVHTQHTASAVYPHHMQNEYTVCIYQMHLHTYTYTYMLVHICIHKCTSQYIGLCMHVCVCVCVLRTGRSPIKQS